VKQTDPILRRMPQADKTRFPSVAVKWRQVAELSFTKTALGQNRTAGRLIVAQRRRRRRFFPLDVATAAGLVSVEAIEVASDDGHRDGKREHAGDGTRGTDQPTRWTDGHLVSIADRRHGDDRPPERVRDAVHLRVVATELGVVDGTGEDEKRDEQRYEEQTETFEARFERQHEHLPYRNRIIVISRGFFIVQFYTQKCVVVGCCWLSGGD